MIERQLGSRVLVFPPVANFRRFLIHKVVEASFPDLKTFSLGEGDDRRTVVCFLSDFKPEVTPEPPTAPVVHKPSKRPRTMPSLGIYRPPAARKLEDNADVSYHSIPLTSENSSQGEDDIKADEITPTSSDEGSVVNNRVARKSANKKERQRRPDMAVYVPRGQRIAQEHQRKLEALSKVQDGVELRLENSLFEDADSDSDKLPVPSYEPRIAPDSNKNSENATEKPFTSLNDENRIERKECLLNESLHSPIILEKEPSIKISPLEASNGDKEESSIVPASSLTSKDKSVDNEKSAEIFPKETGIEESNKSVVNSNILVQTSENARTENGPSSDGEQDWEVLYDDSDALDASLMSQLTKSVGQVSIEKPRSTYEDYTHRSFQEEFPHVVEIYDFPAEFKTPDLMMIFSDYKNLGFEIKWVDDTHALGIFSNASVVADVLRLQHPLVKTRCLSEGSQQSKSKARRCADSLTPYVPRPDTCAALARRLVTGALGVKLPTQRAEREAERRILQQAREKKRLAAKQREEAWEGNFS